MRKIVLTWLALTAAPFGAWQFSAIDLPHFKSARIERLLVTPAHAQLTLTGAGRGAPSGGGSSFSLTYGGNGAPSTSSTQSSFDYGTVSYGGSSCTRIILAVGYAGTGSNFTVSSISVGGSGGTGGTGGSGIATAAANNDGSGGNNLSSEIWETSSSVSGSSGDIGVTFTGGTFGQWTGLTVYCLVTTTPTASAGNSNSNAGSTTLSQSITVPSGGGAIAFGFMAAAFSSFTGLTNDTNFSPQSANQVSGRIRSLVLNWISDANSVE